MKVPMYAQRGHHSRAHRAQSVGEGKDGVCCCHTLHAEQGMGKGK